MASREKKLTEATVAAFTGWDREEISGLVASGWQIDAIRRGYQHGLVKPDAYDHLSLWSKTYLKEGHLWGDEPSETVQLAADRIPDEGKILDVGFGYGRDLLWMAQRRGRVMGIEKSRVGLTIAMNELRRREHEASNGTSLRYAEAELIYGSMKTHRFAKGSLTGIFSHRTVHLPHPDHALPDIAKNMADAVQVGGQLVIGARSIHDFYQDQERMTNILLDSQGFPLSAERKDRPGHTINYFSPERFGKVFGPYCAIKEIYIGKEMEAVGHKKDGKQVDSYYMTAVMEVLPESERALTFGVKQTNLPRPKQFPSTVNDDFAIHGPNPLQSVA